MIIVLWFREFSEGYVAEEAGSERERASTKVDMEPVVARPEFPVVNCVLRGLTTPGTPYWTTLPDMMGPGPNHWDFGDQYPSEYNPHVRPPPTPMAQ